jgi:hypothetical protein
MRMSAMDASTSANAGTLAATEVSGRIARQ